MIDTAPPQGDACDLLAGTPREAAPPRRFEFAHKIFAIENCLFRADPETDEPVYCVDLGDMRARLTFATLRGAFELGADSPDSAMLDPVAKALRFVRRIRPGDAFPAEIVDGTASWRVEPVHRAVAQGRVWIGLVSWLADRRSAREFGMYELARIGDSPDTRRRVQEALGRLAVDMGFGEQGREKVVERVERLVDELSYIEALRDRVGQTRDVVRTLKKLRAAYRRERGTCDDIERTVALIEPPVARLESEIAEVDAQTVETAMVIRDMLRQIVSIRRKRDGLHAQLMKWDEILAAWQGADTTRGASVNRLVRNTYGFVARHFPAEREWLRG